MRAGASTVQQTLTSEAASVLKHSLGLARRRGHAQVTPLHVAATLLSARVSLLRRACLKSHPHSTSHPLQCRALELCFNVALNRLPTTPGPLLHCQPSLSNALIAALKRAQAHQRRGCIEQQQQQPLLAIKVELEQLIISILDDPSVSRVMREAGFSSTCVKNNLEDCSASSSLFYTSTGVLSSSCVETHRELITPSTFWQNSLVFPTQKKQNSTTHFIDSAGETKEDLKLVLEVLLRKKKRNTIIVGDCLSTTGSLVSLLMEKVESGDVPEELKSAHFIKFNISSLSMRFMKRDDVEMKVADLRRKVGTVVSLGGAIIYAGDLKWVVEDVHCENYNPADQMIAEIGRLISDFSSFSSKVWLIGIANYQTYMRCQMKTPSLELQWALQPVAVPSGGLGLSLHASSGLDSRITRSQNISQVPWEQKPFGAKEEQDKLSCCGECISNYEKEASGIFKSSQVQRSSSLITSSDEKEIQKGSNSLPYWMQQFRTDNHNDVLLDLRRKWNRLCPSLLHHTRQNGSSLNQCSYAQQSYPWWSSTLQFNSNSPSLLESSTRPSVNYNGLSQFRSTNQPLALSLDSLKRSENKEVKITLALGNSHFSDSKSSTDQMRGKMDQEELSRALLANLPWQSDTIPSIVQALFDHKVNTGKGSWLMIQGGDSTGKRRLALAIAESVLGSMDRLVQINSKRSTGQSCERTLMEALKKDLNCVVLVEELDYARPDFIKLLARGHEEGKFEDPSGGELSLCQTIMMIIERSSTKPVEDDDRPGSVIQLKLLSEETGNGVSTPSKRKADWDSSTNKSKYPKTRDERDLSVSRQSSFNTLDLNVSAEGDESDSDLTQEAPVTLPTSYEFAESIKNRIRLDRDPTQLDQIRDIFRSKIEAAAAEVCGNEFAVDDQVLDELVNASAYFLDSFFEKWLKDVFQTSCLTVKNGRKGATIRLCFGGKEENVSGFGFLGSSLPNRIQMVM
ncbi:protein SMAX1-LIKE 4-like [Aristolochia californica]|uniref:protein SMAX1-LIKE 4-like n=1 Tax=Aristolochia californica TaxID=171875 RepID=UPI0035E34D48